MFFLTQHQAAGKTDPARSISLIPTKINTKNYWKIETIKYELLWEKLNRKLLNRHIIFIWTVWDTQAKGKAGFQIKYQNNSVVMIRNMKENEIIVCYCNIQPCRQSRFLRSLFYLILLIIYLYWFATCTANKPLNWNFWNISYADVPNYLGWAEWHISPQFYNSYYCSNTNRSILATYINYCNIYTFGLIGYGRNKKMIDTTDISFQFSSSISLKTEITLIRSANFIYI